MSNIAYLISVIFTALGGLAGLSGFTSLFRTTKEAKDTTVELKITTLEDRLEELGRTMRSAARLLNQVEAEIQVRSASAERLKEEAQTAENLVKLNQEQRDAIAKLVRNEIGVETKKVTRQSYTTTSLDQEVVEFVGGCVKPGLRLDREVGSFGRSWRRRPLVFSLLPRCRGSSFSASPPSFRILIEHDE
ncbi:MAG: hypothetical protein JO272_08750 [Pseudonocardiales bacterium]|nr:hypothetical protein [Pseudonocardiales bacterium]